MDYVVGYCGRALIVAGMVGCGGLDCPAPRVVGDDEACVCPDGFAEDGDGCRAVSADENEAPSAVEPPDAVVARYPWNGFATGSVHAAREVAVHPLRPKFMWSSASGAESYQLQIEADCAIASFRTCAFEEPEADIRVAETTAVLSEDLPVSMVPPVGRRYFWRVRACAAEDTCSAWTEVRYLDVGRLTSDYNGDGYSDVLVAAPRADAGGLQGAGLVRVFLGGASGVAPDAVATLQDSSGRFEGRFGLAIAAVGDMNGDGFSEAAVATHGAEFRADSQVHLFWGSPDGLQPDERTVINEPTPQPISGFGEAISSGGDLDGDGFRDFVIAARRQANGAQDEGAAFVFFGSEAGVNAEELVTIDSPENRASDNFGGALDVVGDLNGDGYSDIVITRRGANPLDAMPRIAEVYWGNQERRLEESARSLAVHVGPDKETTPSGVVGVGDLNGDGFSDVLVSSRSLDTSGFLSDDFETRGHVFLGDTEIRELGAVVLEDPSGNDESYASALGRAGDLNGDGFADLIVGSPRAEDRGIAEAGLVYLYFGASFSPQEAESWPKPEAFFAASPQAGVGFASAGWADSDTNGDGYSDLIVGIPDKRNPNNPREHGAAQVHPGSPRGPVATEFVPLRNTIVDGSSSFGERVR